jgi:FAD/FMN-containing dehydrogenase
LSFEIVLPSGEITTVDEEHHPDLYKALRGAGFAGFGIITSFTLEAITPANKKGFWTDISVFGPDKTEQLLDEHHKLMTETVEQDPDAAFLHAFVYDRRHDAKIFFSMHFHGKHEDPETYPEVYKYTEAIEHLAPPKPVIMPYSNVTWMIYGTNAPPGKRQMMNAFTYKPSKELDRRIANLVWEDVIPRVKNISGILPGIVNQPIYAKQRQKKRGGNALGLDDGNETMNLLLTPWTWDNAEDDELCLGIMKEIIDKGEAWAKELGVYHPYIYTNYAGIWQDVLGGYGDENLQWLKKVQKKYDPEGIFQIGSLGSGGFKLNTKETKSNGNGDIKDEL